MREIVIIIWSVLVMLGGMLLMWSLKRTGRKMGKYVMYHKLLLTLVSFGFGWLTYYLLNESAHINWVIRLLVILIGALHLWVMYRQNWSTRDAYNYEKDGFLPELMFTFISGLLCSIAVCSAPQLFEIIPYRVDVSRKLWELPLAFLLPFLIYKLLDFSTQIPYRTVENPWVYPAEPITAENWPWRNLIQVNIQLASSLRQEYYLFSRAAYPWIEAPQEVALGKVFCLMMQERRKRPDLGSIQDMGIEYAGDPQFWWLFSRKRIWWNPSTWFTKPKYLNPDLTLMANKIKEGDVIIARRVPGDGSKPSRLDYNNQASDFDPEKTVFIR